MGSVGGFPPKPWGGIVLSHGRGRKGRKKKRRVLGGKGGAGKKGGNLDYRRTIGKKGGGGDRLRKILNRAVLWGSPKGERITTGGRSERSIWEKRDDKSLGCLGGPNNPTEGTAGEFWGDRPKWRSGATRKIFCGDAQNLWNGREGE